MEDEGSESSQRLSNTNLHLLAFSRCETGLGYYSPPMQLGAAGILLSLAAQRASLVPRKGEHGQNNTCKSWPLHHLCTSGIQPRLF